jgi:hypothetical protein
VENTFPNQLITDRTGADKYVETFLESTNAVAKPSRDKLILVFHNHVLKQPEECKIFGKFATVFHD